MTTNTLLETITARVQQSADSKVQWEQIVKWVGDLPPLPHVASRALALVEDPDVTASKLSNLLGKDAALAARVLKIANSSMYARQREITTINQAIMLIGFKALKGIIIAATLKQLSKQPSEIEKMVWENSTCTAIAAQILAKKIKSANEDEVFVLGLLHDLGKLVLIRQLPKEFEAVVAESIKGIHFAVAEEHAFGCSHAVVGALVAQKWNFPSETCLVILQHHDEIQITHDDNLQKKTALIQTADLLSHCCGVGHFAGYPDCSVAAKAGIAELGLAEGDFDSLVEEITRRFETEGATFVAA